MIFLWRQASPEDLRQREQRSLTPLSFPSAALSCGHDSHEVLLPLPPSFPLSLPAIGALARGATAAAAVSHLPVTITHSSAAKRCASPLFSPSSLCRAPPIIIDPTHSLTRSLTHLLLSSLSPPLLFPAPPPPPPSSLSKPGCRGCSLFLVPSTHSS